MSEPSATLRQLIANFDAFHHNADVYLRDYLTNHAEAIADLIDTAGRDHLMRETWDSGNSEADPDGFVRWCPTCPSSRRRWPCAYARALAALREGAE